MSAVLASRPRLPGRLASAGGPAVLVPVLVAGFALVLAGISHAHHLQAVGGLLRGTVASLVLLLLSGDALSQLLIPQAWASMRPLFALPLGAIASGIVLMAFGVAHVPLSVSLWASLGLALWASITVRRRRRAVSVVGVADGAGAAGVADGAADRLRAWLVDVGPWLAVLAIVFVVALIPGWRTGADTIYGQNPDASQVAGIAVLFQHVPPTATDNALPLDVVPTEWRFRYPIFYPLAAASNLAHFDPIRVFPAMAALLVVMLAFGWAMIAVEFLGVPRRGGPVVAAVIGFSWVAQYLAWHPYWNQLWGTALMPFTVLFGWRALASRDGRAAILFLISLVMLWFAYPLALPYPVVIVGALLIAYWQRPRMPQLAGWRAVAAIAAAVLLLLPAIAGSVLKLEEAISQLLSPHSSLWGGDIFKFLPFGRFVGVGGGAVPAVIVLVVACGGLWVLPRRPRIAVGLVLGALCLLDLRFRLVSSGTYMDFKHLSFVGTMVLTLAASAVVRLLWSRRALLLGAGAVLAVVWIGAALVLDRSDAISQGDQVTAAEFQLRDWAARLPAGASVSVDIPPEHGGGVQLWAVYMLGDHPVNSPTPVIGTTYAYAAKGGRADYSLDLRYYPNGNPNIKVPFPPGFGTVGPPVFENSQFVLRRIVWPKKLDWYPLTASTKLVEP
jgi:hypothetical protein